MQLTALTPVKFMQRYRLLIADADGTIRRCTIPDQPCPNKPDEWELIPEAEAWLKQIDWNRCCLGIASNQGGIGLGYLSATDAYQMLCQMVVDAIQRFPPQGALQICPSLNKEHRDRKPNPGMLEKIMMTYGCYPRKTLMVGDLESDRLAAERCGIDFIWAWDLFEFKKDGDA